MAKKQVKKTKKKATAVKKETSVKKKKVTAVKKKATVKKKAAPRKNTTSAKITSPARRSVRAKKSAKSHLSKSDIEHFTKLLFAKRLELIGDVDSIENEALKKSRLDASGDLSSMPIHMADVGTDNYEQEFTLGLIESERKLLRDIAYAIQRIEDKTYGICEGTGEAIPKARLEAAPWARYSVKYARLIEEGLAEEVEPGETKFDFGQDLSEDEK